MRTDDGTKYSLPGFVHQDPEQAKYWEKGITFHLQGLPMIHDDGVQTGVGARGWYNSAVLSALLLLLSSTPPSSSSSSSNEDAPDNDNNDNNGNTSSSMMGDLLRQDMINLMKQQSTQNQKNPTILEIGAGALGLVGMTMAWILSHKHQLNGDDCATTINVEANSDVEEKNDDYLDIELMGDNNDDESKVILTDNDVECLTQLQCNVTSVLQSLLEFNSGMHKDGINNNEDSKEQEGQWLSPSPVVSADQEMLPFLSLPSIQTKVLDWDDHAIDQEVLVHHKIDFVVGAELAYTSNNCCAMQVAKILELNPQAVIWIVQFPRKGWFQVFQLELQKALPNVVIQKTDPTRVHKEVHELAQSIMPMPCGMGSNSGNDDVDSHEHFSYRLEDIKALRITVQQPPPERKDSVVEEEATSSGPKVFDLNEQIQQSKRLSEQLSATQEFALDSHWELG